MSYRNINEKKEEEEHDIIKNYHGALAKAEKKKKSGGFQSMGIFNHSNFLFLINFLIIILIIFKRIFLADFKSYFKQRLQVANAHSKKVDSRDSSRQRCRGYG